MTIFLNFMLFLIAFIFQTDFGPHPQYFLNCNCSPELIKQYGSGKGTIRMEGHLLPESPPASRRVQQNLHLRC